MKADLSRALVAHLWAEELLLRFTATTADTGVAAAIAVAVSALGAGSDTVADGHDTDSKSGSFPGAAPPRQLIFSGSDFLHWFWEVLCSHPDICAQRGAKPVPKQLLYARQTASALLSAGIFAPYDAVRVAGPHPPQLEDDARYSMEHTPPAAALGVGPASAASPPRPQRLFDSGPAGGDKGASAFASSLFDDAVCLFQRPPPDASEVEIEEHNFIKEGMLYFQPPAVDERDVDHQVHLVSGVFTLVDIVSHIAAKGSHPSRETGPPVVRIGGSLIVLAPLTDPKKVQRTVYVMIGAPQDTAEAHLRYAAARFKRGLTFLLGPLEPLHARLPHPQFERAIAEAAAEVHRIMCPSWSLPCTPYTPSSTSVLTYRMGGRCAASTLGVYERASSLVRSVAEVGGVIGAALFQESAAAPALVMAYEVDEEVLALLRICVAEAAADASQQAAASGDDAAAAAAAATAAAAPTAGPPGAAAAPPTFRPCAVDGGGPTAAVRVSGARFAAKRRVHGASEVALLPIFLYYDELDEQSSSDEEEDSPTAASASAADGSAAVAGADSSLTELDAAACFPYPAHMRPFDTCGHDTDGECEEGRYHGLYLHRVGDVTLAVVVALKLLNEGFFDAEFQDGVGRALGGVESVAREMAEEERGTAGGTSYAVWCAADESVKASKPGDAKLLAECAKMKFMQESLRDMLDVSPPVSDKDAVAAAAAAAAAGSSAAADPLLINRIILYNSATSTYASSRAFTGTQSFFFSPRTHGMSSVAPNVGNIEDLAKKQLGPCPCLI